MPSQSPRPHSYPGRRLRDGLSQPEQPFNPAPRGRVPSPLSSRAASPSPVQSGGKTFGSRGKPSPTHLHVILKQACETNTVQDLQDALRVCDAAHLPPDDFYVATASRSLQKLQAQQKIQHFRVQEREGGKRYGAKVHLKEAESRQDPDVFENALKVALDCRVISKAEAERRHAAWWAKNGEYVRRLQEQRRKAQEAKEAAKEAERKRQAEKREAERRQREEEEMKKAARKEKEELDRARLMEATAKTKEEEERKRLQRKAEEERRRREKAEEEVRLRKTAEERKKQDEELEAKRKAAEAEAERLRLAKEAELRRIKEEERRRAQEEEEEKIRLEAEAKKRAESQKRLGTTMRVAQFRASIIRKAKPPVFPRELSGTMLNKPKKIKAKEEFVRAAALVGRCLGVASACQGRTILVTHDRGGALVGFSHSNPRHYYPEGSEMQNVEECLNHACKGNFLGDDKENLLTHRIIMTEDQPVKSQVRESLSTSIFDEYQFRGMMWVDNWVACLAAVSERRTGMIIELGSDVTRVTPIYSGYPLEKAMRTMQVYNGKMLDLALASAIAKGHEADILKRKPEDPQSLQAIGHRFREQRCEVAYDYEARVKQEMERVNSEDGEPLIFEFKGRDDYVQVYIETQHISVPEVYFQPKLIETKGIPKGDYERGIHDWVWESLQAMEPDLWADMVRNIYLVGDCADIVGFRARLQKELVNLLPRCLDVKVYGTTYKSRRECAHAGIKKMAHSPDIMEQMVLSTDIQYREILATGETGPVIHDYSGFARFDW